MYLFIDTDPGLDDFLALSYLFQTSKYEIVGISSTVGNIDINSSTKNLKLITGIFYRKSDKKVTIYKGVSKPIVQVDKIDAKMYHGSDGLAEFWSSDYARENEIEINDCCEHCIISDIPAVLGLIELSKKYSGDLIIMALGPLSNIALAQIIDPDFGSRVKEIVIMGGDISGAGNCDIHLASEFNFSFDPEAAFVVFQEIQCKKIVLPLETVIPLSINHERGLLWLKEIESKTDLYSKILHFIIKFKIRNKTSFRLYDLILAILFIEPELIISTLNALATIELSGKYTRGKVIIDFHNKSSQLDFQHFSEINFIKSVNCDEIFKRLGILFS